jgi:hypothetical protein
LTPLFLLLAFTTLDRTLEAERLIPVVVDLDELVLLGLQLLEPLLLNRLLLLANVVLCLR